MLIHGIYFFFGREYALLPMEEYGYGMHRLWIPAFCYIYSQGGFCKCLSDLPSHIFSFFDVVLFRPASQIQLYKGTFNIEMAFYNQCDHHTYELLT